MSRIARSFRPVALAMLVGPLLSAPALAADEKKEEPTLSDIVNILHEKGLIDDEQHAALEAKAAAEQAKQDKGSWTDRFTLFGDLRGRFESFEYDQDIYTKSAGAELENRYRARYRARLGVTADVVSRASATLQLATGGADPRSANQTLGSGNDFDKDEFRVDLAYMTLSPFPKGELPGVENGYLGIDLGKVKNPFVWKELPGVTGIAFDNLLWDNDINPEGGNLRIAGNAGPVKLYANGGVYVISENAAAKDPKFAAGQIGASTKLADIVTVGLRGTLYDFFSLDDAFFARAASNLAAPGGTGGNIIDGLSRGGSITVGETSAYLNVRPHPLLPITFYGTYAHNYSAHPSLVSTANKENDAWMVGTFVGDKVGLVTIGLAYYYLEANAFPSMYVDSDVLDGFPNRQGYSLAIQRQLFENVDFTLRGYKDHRIQGGTAFVNSGPGSDRIRTQADVTLKF